MQYCIAGTDSDDDSDDENAMLLLSDLDPCFQKVPGREETNRLQ